MMESQHQHKPHVPSQAEIRAAVVRQIQEIDRYKWCLGEKLGHDPLRDRSYDEIASEWIQKYAAEFRAGWARRVEEERRRRNA